MINHLIEIHPELKNINFCSLNENTQRIDLKTIYQIQTSRKGYGKRSGCEVDREHIELILKKFDSYQFTPFFTTLDYQSDNTVNMPLGFISCKSIKKTSQYYKEYNQSIKHYGNLFWRGDVTTHETRSKIISYFSLKNNSNFNVANWCPANGKFYKDNACTEHEYDTYFNRLKQSDAFLVMRGDRPWTNSFFDCLRANAIPVCIDTFYHKLGWHKIGFKIDDLFLDFDSKKDSLEKIEDEIQILLKNKDRVLHMKQNLLSFYKEFILKDRYLVLFGASLPCVGWGEIIKSKLLETHNNDYILRDNYLF